MKAVALFGQVRQLSVALAFVLLGNCSEALADVTLYEQAVKPVLQHRCFPCHGALKQESGLRLDTAQAAVHGGDSGPGLVAGSPDVSLLIERVEAEDPSERMPPEGEPLTVEQIAALRQWILEGAAAPEDEQAEEDPEHHWAYQPIVKPATPDLKEGQLSGRASHQTPNHPIDAFIAFQCAERGIRPAGELPRELLLRRLSIDLIGLPPTREELIDFLSDQSEDAYEKQVDRLLADPRHGERWARHWMDVWRYSDWYGRRDQNDVRNSAGQIFRWRDWIVDSLNQGKGYDRMIQEMLAADEICPEDYQAGVATGFLIRNYYSLNPNDWMRSIVEHTGKAFLGLTFNCAHCHDHKYDPIEQDDYFKLRAFFEPIYIRQDRVPGERDPGPFEDYTYAGTRSVQRLGAVRIFDSEPDATTWFYTDGDERNRREERGSMPPGVPSFLNFASLDLQSVDLPPKAWYPGLRLEIQESLRSDARNALREAHEQFDSLSGETAVTQDRCAIDAPQLSLLEAEIEAAIQRLDDEDSKRYLSGQQSLVLDSTNGRAAVENDLRGFLDSFDQNLRLEFQLHLLQDGHFNLQLLKNNLLGHTAAYVGWDSGLIKAYVPGQSGESVVGKYDWASGQTHFSVALLLQPSKDQALLSVSTAVGQVLLDQVPVQLGGWNPIQQENQTLFLDAQNNCVAAIDDLVLSRVSNVATSVTASPGLLDIDFQSPSYDRNAPPFGRDGWQETPFARGLDSVLVSTMGINHQLWSAYSRSRTSRLRASLPELQRNQVELTLKAVEAELRALEARIAAENFRFDHSVESINLNSEHVTAEEVSAEKVSAENLVPSESFQTWERLAREANAEETTAKHLKSQSELLARKIAVLQAEALPNDDPGRSKALAAAQQALADGGQSLSDRASLVAYSPLSVQYPPTSTGRRRALAEWITHRDNPLTARVAVNHIWARRFHRAIVDTVADFGRNGSQPQFPELLDWLAAELIESGWDMKHLHRLMVTSQTYRRHSSIAQAPQSHAIDPENRYLWRMNAGRMEAEVVRDSLLFVSGRLESLMGGVELENSEALTSNRRSLYYSCHPEAGGKNGLGALFDAADALECYRRVRSIVPQQALALTNSDFVQQTCSALASAWQPSAEASHDDHAVQQQFIRELFETILSRRPTESEQELCHEIMDHQRGLVVSSQPSAVQQRVRESLIRVLLNHNDFVNIR
jgi:hypothetical protein